MKLAIIGTSSSIMREGYAASLSKIDGVEVVDNASLGSSHAVLVPFMLDRIGKAKPDFLLIDTCLNERRALAKGPYDLAASKSVLASTLVWCAAKNVIPVVLILPDIMPKNASSGVVRRFYVELCGRWGVPYFDGFAFIDEYSREYDRPVEDLFYDWLHLKVEVGASLSTSLVAALIAFSRQSSISKPWSLTRVYRGVPVDQGQSEVRSSSLVTTRVARITPSQSVKIKLPLLSQIAGIVINSAGTNASIQVGGKTKRLDSRLYRSAALILVAWALVDPISRPMGNAILQAVPSRADAGFEENDHMEADFDPTTMPEHVVELAALIVRGPPLPRRRLAMRGGILDLYALGRALASRTS